ncbi:hypothetical protein [Pseudomonas fluorescens]|uniref:Uncharacterized protein n=1 Tax=Pseudomonas fluorescens TaxID=294 RepID=A0A5E7CAQ9_PSEFL|nr:hypothetical protein [Pseudomonas fluorescens]VVO01710.1 hypothetical protein PS691_02683 [Pseudomonas fluorescens]
MKFDLDNFKKPAPTADTTSPYQTSVAQKLHAKILKEYQQISLVILKRSVLTTKERQIVARQIALSCGVSPSTLTPRRQPGLVALIDTLNDDLELQWKSTSAKKSHSGRKNTKKELMEENTLLKTENERLSNLQLAGAMTAAIESMLTEEARLQASTIRQLKSEISRLNKVIDNQAELQQRMLYNINKP